VWAGREARGEEEEEEGEENGNGLWVSVQTFADQPFSPQKRPSQQKEVVPLQIAHKTLAIQL